MRQSFASDSGAFGQLCLQILCVAFFCFPVLKNKFLPSISWAVLGDCLLGLLLNL